jgi:hypothetical protein
MSSPMLQYAIKIMLTAVLVVSVSEVAKRSSFWGATLASLPLTSVLAFAWLYIDTGDTQRVGALSHGILWLIIPSLVLFIALPLLLKAGVGFWLSLAASCAATAVAYVAMVRVLAHFGIRA